MRYCDQSVREFPLSFSSPTQGQRSRWRWHDFYAATPVVQSYGKRNSQQVLQDLRFDLEKEESTVALSRKYVA